MVGRHPFIRALAKAAAKRITRRFIRAMQEFKDFKLSGDDSELSNIWDEICAQVQFQEFDSWAAYVESSHATLGGLITDLSDHKKQALWLQSEAGWDWDYDTRDANAICPICEEEILEYVWNEYVIPEAGRWSNARIRAYLLRAESTD